MSASRLRSTYRPQNGPHYAKASGGTRRRIYGILGSFLIECWLGLRPSHRVVARCQRRDPVFTERLVLAWEAQLAKYVQLPATLPTPPPPPKGWRGWFRKAHVPLADRLERLGHILHHNVPFSEMEPAVARLAVAYRSTLEAIMGTGVAK